MAGAMAGSAILNCGHTKSLHTVTLTINNRCNLSCPHCYLQYEGPASLIAYRTLDLLERSRFKHLAIVGKEPLLDSRSMHLCEEIADRISSEERTTSLITNGLNLVSTPVSLLRKLSYVDVSFDAGPVTYGSYRGGSFAKLSRGLERLNAIGKVRTNALFVLSSSNIDNIDDMLAVRNLFPFERLVFSPYVATKNEGVNTANELPLEVILDRLARSKTFVNDSRAVFVFNSFPEATHTSQNHVTANPVIARKVIHIADDPLNYGIIRLTYDGYVLTPIQSLHTHNYKSNGININSYDLTSNGLETIYNGLRNDFYAFTN